MNWEVSAGKSLWIVSLPSTMFVGDHPDTDIGGALGAGLRAIWKRVPHWEIALKDVPVVDKLSEILSICL